MIRDKYSAVWVSHSSITDYLRCPRAYYLRNIYRNPRTNRKISLMAPAFALGQVVHDVVESLSALPAEKRFDKKLEKVFIEKWQNVTGEKGGFSNREEESIYRMRGEAMMTRIRKNPGLLLEKAIKIRQPLPYFWLSDDENIILCGKIDWLTYDSKNDSVKIIDFKTGRFDEDPDSLQLPIYLLLAQHCQTKPVSGASYWYLDRDDEPVNMELPDEHEAYEKVLEIAKRVALARKLERFVCPSKDGCPVCRPYEAIVGGKAKQVGTNTYNTDVYMLTKN